MSNTFRSLYSTRKVWGFVTLPLQYVYIYQKSGHLVSIGVHITSVMAVRLFLNHLFLAHEYFVKHLCVLEREFLGLNVLTAEELAVVVITVVSDGRDD